MPNHWISETTFDEAEYLTPEHLTVAFFIMIHRDMAGVVEINPRVCGAKCRMSGNKFIRILNYFEEKGKLQFSTDRCKIFWKSGIFHSLYRGNFSEKQLKSVQKLLVKHQNSGKFGHNFAESVSQLYANKYSIDIPIPTDVANSVELQSKSESKTKSEAEAKGPAANNSEFKTTEARKIWERLQYGMGDWRVCLQDNGRGGMNFCSDLIDEHTVEHVLDTLERLGNWYTKKDLQIPTAPEIARGKILEWCATQYKYNAERDAKQPADDSHLWTEDGKYLGNVPGMG